MTAADDTKIVRDLLSAFGTNAYDNPPKNLTDVINRFKMFKNEEHHALLERCVNELCNNKNLEPDYILFGTASWKSIPMQQFPDGDEQFLRDQFRAAIEGHNEINKQDEVEWMMFEDEETENIADAEGSTNAADVSRDKVNGVSSTHTEEELDMIIDDE